MDLNKTIYGVKMANIYDVEPQKLIKATAEKLKVEEIVTPPKWISFVKSGSHRERLIEDPDFWYVRCASLLRKLALYGPIGIQRMRREYGGRKRHGSNIEHFRPAGGAIIRKALQQLEKAGFVEKKAKGRAITPKGLAFLSSSLKK